VRIIGSARGRGVTALAVLALVAGGCNLVGAASRGSPTPISLPTQLPDGMSFEQTLPLFEFDRSLPFDVQEMGAWPVGKATLEEVVYSGTGSLRMPAYLVLPPGEGPFAGIVWMGSYGDWINIRNEFVMEAAAMAERGVASVLVSGYFPSYEAPRGKDADRMNTIVQVRELRRAVDLLQLQKGVDPGRLAFVGHGWGATHGVSLAAVDGRLKAAVLLAPNCAIADLVFTGYGLDPAIEPAYRKAMAPFDPLAMAPHAAPTALFFQFSREDSFVSEATAMKLFGAASEPKRIGWYAGAHDLDEQAHAERDAWLEEQLQLTTN
jgi:dienelactone hydrolase